MYNFDKLLNNTLLKIPHVIYKNKDYNIYNWLYYNKKNQLIRFSIYQYNFNLKKDKQQHISYDYKFYIYNETTSYYDVINYNLENFLNDELKYLEKTIEYKNNIDNLVDILKKYIGNYTFATGFDIGWNFKLLNIKITINKYKSPSNKTIKLEFMDSNKKIKISQVNAQQLIDYVKNNQDLFNSYFKELHQRKELSPNTILQNNYENVLSNNISNLNIYESNDQILNKENYPTYSIYNYNTNKNNLLYKEVREKYKNLFIIYPKEKRLYIQSCLTPKISFD